MDELVAWFAAQLDHHEQVARKSLRTETGEYGEWFRSRTLGTDASDVWDLNSRSEQPDRGFYRLADNLDPEVVGHIALNNPAAVLRSIAADRVILREYKRLQLRDRLRSGPWWDGCRNASESAVRLRAEAYAHRPGYQERWRLP
ncbi:DUF6221 family protein [Micromonospora tulbaghiae]|uniref:DUF6221 family protein n=1 Tax=Micromonospora tulbaghiae TaxID=479978 RepID=UPI0033BC19A6